MGWIPKAKYGYNQDLNINNYVGKDKYRDVEPFSKYQPNKNTRPKMIWSEWYLKVPFKKWQPLNPGQVHIFLQVVTDIIFYGIFERSYLFFVAGFAEFGYVGAAYSIDTDCGLIRAFQYTRFPDSLGQGSAFCPSLQKPPLPNRSRSGRCRRRY